MMEAKLPGCGIKATPHITSRLKTLKRLWQTAYDIIYEPNTSGFGWDPETKLVTADDDVREEYLKGKLMFYRVSQCLVMFELWCKVRTLE
ncbi:hypothetical protein K1719_043987 [Acacia pycnantha]|nr:hypothetical protein K1719_043987 [Acacia pycnantha]